MAITKVGWGAASITASSSFSITISNGTDPGSVWDPATDDLILLFLSANNTIAATTDTASWTNLLGSAAEINSGANLGAHGWRHFVTSGEAGASTVTYSDTLNVGSETGEAVAVVLRGVDTTTPINVFESLGGASATPHILVGLTSAGSSQPTVSGATVVSFVAKDGTGAYSGTGPTGWTTATLSTNTNQGGWLGTRDTLTTSGVDVADTNITPSAADEYVSITVAVVPAAGSGDDLTQDEADDVGITDSVTVALAKVREFADNLGITDSTTVVEADAVTHTDNLGITDSIEIAVGEGHEEDDPIGITDTVDVVAGLVVVAEDPIGITDSVVVVVVNALEFTDPIGITDTAVLVIANVLQITDNLGITDSITILVGGAATFADNVGITETVVVELDKFLSGESDDVGIDDSVTIVVGLRVTVTDTIGIDDTVTAEAEEEAAGGNICLTVGAPVFVSRLAFVVVRTRSAAVEMVDRSAGGPEFQPRSAALDSVDRSATHRFQSRQAGEPEFEGRNATLTFQDREADIVLDCEEV